MEKIKVLNIIQDSIVDGVGLRSTIFFSGCPHKCKGCHNPESWNINYGTNYTVDEIINNVQNKRVTLSGGDPLSQSKEILPLVERLRELEYDIWIYTGWKWEEILKDEDMHEVVKLCDVIVDGKYDMELRDVTLAFKGSSNQRIIDVPKSILYGYIVEWVR